MSFAQILPMKLPSPRSSSRLVSKETIDLIRTLTLSSACHVVRAIVRAKSFLVKIAWKIKRIDCFQSQFTPSTRRRGNEKIYLGSFRFHYNWGSSSSSDMQPFPAPILGGFSTSHLNYCDQGEPGEDRTGELQLSEYLEWLEGKGNGEESDNGATADEGCIDEIDKLADMFITKCHQLFILERQESYRRFQEMIAV